MCCVQRPARASHGGQARVEEFELQPMPITKGVKKEEEGHVVFTGDKAVYVKGSELVIASTSES